MMDDAERRLRAAVDAAFPGLPEGMTMDEAKRRIAAALEAADEGYPPRKEWIVLYAPGWPSGIQPTPNTREEGERFVREDGGRLFWRWTCAWREVEVREVAQNDQRGVG